MILSDTMILQEMAMGNIIIDPFQKDHLNPNSVDLTLSPACKIYTTRLALAKTYKEIPEDIRAACEVTRLKTGEYVYFEPLDIKKKAEVLELTIPKEGYVLKPGEVYLYSCMERIGVKGSIRAKVEGKSSLGRLGLFIHVTAGFIDTGFEGSLVLELVATKPIRIYPYMKVCQVEFARVEGEIAEAYNEKKGSKYFDQSGVQESLMHMNY
jgi:dCTP deaminase